MTSDSTPASVAVADRKPSNALAISGITRQWVAKLHRWSGLALLVFLAIAAVTGAAMAFRWEIDRLINPHLFNVAPQARALAVDDWIRSVESRFPDVLVGTTILPKTAQDSAILYVKSRMQVHVTHVHVVGMKGSVDFNQIFVNPYTAEVLGQRSTTRFVPNWEHLMPDLVRLHYALFMDEAGAWIMGVSALVWLLTTLVGLALSWPKSGRSWRNWRGLLRVRQGAGQYKLHYDLHRSANLLTLPVLVVVAFTSVYLNLPGAVKPVVKALSPQTGTLVVPTVRAMDLDSPRVAPEPLMALAQQAFPDAQLQSVGRDFVKGVYSVRLIRPGDVSPTGNTTLYYDMATGQQTMLRTMEQGSAGDVFQAWMWPLHTGRAFGLVGQCLILAGALVLLLTCWTGFTVWWRKRVGQVQRLPRGRNSNPSGRALSERASPAAPAVVSESPTL